jgi:ankyrin repeat protein
VSYVCSSHVAGLTVLARPDFAGEISGITAINLAVKFRRSKIIPELMQLGVDVSIADLEDKSPLFYAAGNGDYAIVKDLLRAGAQQDDGSLHEAARNCFPDIVAELINGGHDPGFPSFLHNGRSALAELCLNCQSTDRNWQTRAYTTIQLLFNGIDLSLKDRDGKTILHLALENNQPLLITKLLLRFRGVYEDIRTDSEAFLFEDQDHLCYSPNRYVEHKIDASVSLKQSLIKLLKDSNCKDKYFAWKGPQPPGYNGLPPALKDIVRRAEMANEAQRLEDERKKTSTQFEIQLGAQRHAILIQQKQEISDVDYRDQERAHEQRSRQQRILADQRMSEKRQEQAEERSHLQQTAEIEYSSAHLRAQLNTSTAREQSQVEYEGLQRISQVEYNSMERKANLQTRMIKEQEAAEINQHKRQKDIMDQQSRFARLQIEAAGRMKSASNVKLLDYHSELD